MIRFIGIDPGLSGGVVIIDELEHILFKSPMPIIDDGKKKIVDVQVLASYVYADPSYKQYAALEKVSAMPGQGVTSMFSFGCAFGMAQATLSLCNIPFELVPPQTWQKVLLSSFAKGESKKAALAFARRRIPLDQLLATERSKVPHDGIVDAYCLAVYARALFSWVK